YIGLERDDSTLRPTSYYEKLPPMQDRHVLLLDPMLATGGAAPPAGPRPPAQGAAPTPLGCGGAAPPGGGRPRAGAPPRPASHAAVSSAALDRALTDNGYIRPGLGDFGDRLFGTEPHLGAPPNP